MKVDLLLRGQADAFSRSPHQYIADLATAKGGLGRFRLYHRQAVAIADPDLARQVLIRQVELFQRGRHFRTFGLFLGDGLLSTDGDLWRPARQWLDSGFRRETLALTFPTIQAVIEAELACWQKHCQHGNGVLDLMPALKQLTARLITRTLFSLSWHDTQIAAFCELIDESMQDTLNLIRQPLAAPAWWPGSLAGRVRRSGQTLSRLLASALEQGDALQVNGSLLPLLRQGRPDSRCPLTAGRWLDELKTLAVAAFETSATTLAWTLDLLARHPQECRAVQREIDETIGSNAPRLADLSRLRRCEQVLLESMRLWPAVHNVVREARAATMLGEHAIAEGTLAFVSIYGLHRHPDLWECPNDFLPERFADRSLQRPGYFPFAIGPHACLGKHLALLQMQTFLILFCQRFHFSSLDQTPQQAVAQVTLRPHQSPHLILRERA
jgi:cytochrome P450